MTERRFLRRAWVDLGRPADELDLVDPLPVPALPSRLSTAALAAESVAAASLAGAVASVAGTDRPAPRVRLSGPRIAAAVSSERSFRLDGESPDVWAPMSGFFRARDGWVRTHGNYPHHAAALRRALGLGADATADDLAAVLARTDAADASQRVTAAGGLCVVVAPEQPSVDAALAATPLVEVRRLGDAAPRAPLPGAADAPLAGVRVLDLTRVIAGPVCTRTLALLGADVLRIDSPRLPEPEWQHLDSGAGKRSALVDAGTAEGRARLERLLADADVLVTGYRPEAIAGLGLAADDVAARHPGIVVVQLAAWGFGAADRARRGFDSIVQAASGIGCIEGGERPEALPAQVLDHATGYLLAATAVTILERQRADGGSWSVHGSLRRTAAELLRSPRAADPSPPETLTAEARALQEVEFADPPRVRTVLPAVAFDGLPDAWPSAPHAWGSDAPEWAR
ncbi:CoA transferase [Agromyces mangrovi Wang et al. 2018]|uniref:CoA transferase n=1 Tax=Agromyces mangrovi TaxID=1858653 RepID=UPI00257330E2|nr:CoA transferase [Agromyces mangrovi]BDZ66126.1 putative L-carnitine dehydratase [Agromyces mangrovi]